MMDTLRKKIFRLAIYTSVMAIPAVWGQNQSADAVSAADMQILEEFLNLDDAELARIQSLIQKIREMSPEVKTAYKEKIREFHALEPAQRSAIRRGWGQMSHEIRQSWMEMMHSLPDEERMRIQEHMFDLGPAERMAYRRGLVEEYLKAQKAK